MPTLNEWRGDAPPVAQVLDLLPPKNDGIVELYIGGRPLGYQAKWNLDAMVKFWNNSPQGEFREVIASMGDGTLRLTAKEAGRPFAVTTTVGGESVSNEVQLITLSNATGGTFTLSFLTETTSAIAYNATAATLQAALVALTAIAPGDVLVSKVGTVWTVRFKGAYAATDVPPLRVNFAGLTGGTCAVIVTPTQTGILPVNCVQVVSLDSTITGGTATLTWNGGTTSALAWNASSATVQTAVNTAWGSGVVTVTGSTLKAGLTFTFDGLYAAQDVSLITGNGLSLTGGLTLLTVSTLTPGVAGSSSTYNFRLVGDPSVADSAGRTGYRFKIQLGNFLNSDAWTTAEIPYTASAATIQAALNTMTPINLPASGAVPLFGDGNVVVSGTLNGSWVGGSAGLTITVGGRYHSLPIAVNPVTGDWLASPPINRSIYFTGTTGGAGAAGTNEVQKILQSSTSSSGTFRIIYDGIASEQIEYCSGTTQGAADAWAAKIRAALAAHPSIGTTGDLTASIPGAVCVQPAPSPGQPGSFVNVGVVAVGGSAPYATLTFLGAGLQSKNVSQITVVEAATVVYVTKTVTGYAGQAAKQSINMTGAPWGGTWTLTYSGQTTSGMAPQISANDLRLALEALSNLVPGNVLITGAYPNWLATFPASLGNVDTMIGNGSALRNGNITIETPTAGGVSIVQNLITRSRGPWHGDDPLNWTLGRVNQHGDSPWFRTGATGPRWGINWRTAFTLDTLDDTLIKIPGGYSFGGDFVDGQAVRVRTAGTLPSGLATNTTYYVRDWSGNGFRLSASLDGSPITLSGGSGAHEIYVQLDGLKTFSNWTGGDAGIGNYLTDKIGGFREYRPLYLRCLWTTGAKITLSEGIGSGSGMVRLDTGDSQVVIEVLGSGGSREQGLPPVLWIGQNTLNVFNNYGGAVGIGLLRDEVVTLKDYIQRSGSVEIGPGVTFTAAGTIDVTAGKVLSQATIAGPAWIRG